MVSDILNYLIMVIYITMSYVQNNFIEEYDLSLLSNAIHLPPVSYQIQF